MTMDLSIKTCQLLEKLICDQHNLNMPLFFNEQDFKYPDQRELKVLENLTAQKKAFYAALSIPYIDEKVSLQYEHQSKSPECVLKYEKSRLEFEEENDTINILTAVQEIQRLKETYDGMDHDQNDLEDIPAENFKILENMYFKHRDGHKLLSYCAMLALAMEYIDIHKISIF